VNPTPSPIDVVVHSAPAADWQVWAAFAPLIAAIIAAFIAGGALWQRWKADNRAEWWRRAQWALESSFSDNPDRSKLGLGIMEGLADTAPGPEEARIIAIASADPLQVAEEARFEDASAPDNETQGAYVTSVTVPPVRARVDAAPDQVDNETTTEREE
jgi:hypothetical protein